MQGVDWFKVSVIVALIGVMVAFGFIGVVLVGIGVVAYKVWERAERRKREAIEQREEIVKIVER